VAIAEQVVNFLTHGVIHNAVNGPVRGPQQRTSVGRGTTA
jgi:hypothetical protein